MLIAEPEPITYPTTLARDTDTSALAAALFYVALPGAGKLPGTPYEVEDRDGLLQVGARLFLITTCEPHTAKTTKTDPEMGKRSSMSLNMGFSDTWLTLSSPVESVVLVNPRFDTPSSQDSSAREVKWKDAFSKEMES